MRRSCRTLLVACGLAFPAQCVISRAAELPAGFVYLSDIDPAIAQDMHYAGADNFTHAPVAGYRAPECVLTKAAAAALAKVRRDLLSAGYGLKVWDCYRPAKAVHAFMAWTRRGADFDNVHHPRVARDRLVAEGYIGKRSGHSSGSTIDLTLISLDGREVDMGTGFDFFDPLSHTASTGVSSAARANRGILSKAMQLHGFRNYAREWWHFTLEDQPFRGRRFDFDIRPKGG